MASKDIKKSQRELACTIAEGLSSLMVFPSVVKNDFCASDISLYCENDFSIISQGIGLVFSTLILNLLEVFSFIKPKSTTGSTILRVGPLNVPVH